ncbi:MAG: hypothetical protein ACP5QN_02260 [Minisyncoccia bacterium]
MNENKIYLKDKINYYIIAAINIYGVLFLNWDLFLIMYISWLEFFVLAIFTLIHSFRYIILSLITKEKYIDSYKSAFGRILVFILFNCIALFLYGVFMTIFFKGDVFITTPDRDAIIFIKSFINFMTQFIKFVWLPVLIYTLNYLYNLIFLDMKLYTEITSREFGLKILIHHFFLIFLGTLFFNSGLNLKILIILIILFKLYSSLSAINQKSVKTIIHIPGYNK